MEEHFDVVDIDRRPLGRTSKRGATLSEGEFHLIVMAAILNGEGRILLTRRSGKKIAAGMWECTAGSVIAGESSKDAVLREIREEIGISVYVESAGPIAWFIEDDGIFDLWVFHGNWELDELTLQKTEVDAAKYATLSEIREIIRTGVATKSLDEIVKLAEKGILKISN
jgi:NADH pyrophosphatase NudC (nudix superfamily)